MDEIEPSCEVQSSSERAGLVAWLACLGCLILLFLFAKPEVDLVESGWEQLLIYAMFPILIAFLILELSSMHREMKTVWRMPFLLMVAFLLFGAALIFTAVAAMVLFSFAHLGSGHG